MTGPRQYVPMLLAVATGLSRTPLVGCVIGVCAFAVLTVNLGPRMRKPVAVLLGLGALAIPIGVAFVAIEGAGTFKRYEGIVTPEAAVTSAAGDKSNARSLIPHELETQPFGVGLGTVGSVGGFGGNNTTELLEGHGVSNETELNNLADELGLPGLILWLAFVIRVLSLPLRGLRRIGDPDLKLAIAGLAAPLVAILAMGFNGPVEASSSSGPYLFFAAGALAYWFAGPGRRRAASDSQRARPDAFPAPSPSAQPV